MCCKHRKTEKETKQNKTKRKKRKKRKIQYPNPMYTFLFRK